VYGFVVEEEEDEYVKEEEDTCDGEDESNGDSCGKFCFFRLDIRDFENAIIKHNKKHMQHTSILIRNTILNFLLN
jgi:hypothetical protein